MKTTVLSLDETRRDALLNMGISREAYERHCIRFLASCRDSAGEIKKLLSQGRTDDAAICAHSVKGLAATLGFADLSHAASSLEAALKNGSSCSDELQNYTSVIAALPKE